MLGKAAETGGGSPIRVLRKGGQLMSTYEVLMVLLNSGLLIVTYLEWKDKKKPS